ncbi:MAG: hypothetical protein HY301_17070 [Verrucomicrobia bacterium]|nr:hypothetical protein [Verrucomicrobiota bacterium]
MSTANAKTFFETIETPDLPDLGPGPRAGVLPPAELLAKVDAWLADKKLSARTANLVRAAALLWHDHHDAAHAIVQDDPSAEASFLHAILHRREPDPGNAANWNRRVGRHPVYTTIAKRVGEFLDGDEFKRWRDILVPDGRWEPDAFVDACYVSNPREYTYPLFQKIQSLEMEALLDYLRRRG